MTWGRLDDQLWCNAKVLSFSLPARSLWFLSLSFGNCEQSQPVGHLTVAQAAVLAAAAGATKRHMVELVDKNGWELVEDGYIVHDLAKYQKRDETATDRVRQWRQRQRAVTADVTESNADVTRSGNDEVTVGNGSETRSGNANVTLPGPGPGPGPGGSLKTSQPKRARARENSGELRELTEDEIEQLVRKFGPAFEGAEGIRAEIEYAYEWASRQPKSKRWADPWLAIQHWFRESRRYLTWEAREHASTRNGHRPGASAGASRYGHLGWRPPDPGESVAAAAGVDDTAGPDERAGEVSARPP